MSTHDKPNAWMNAEGLVSSAPGGGYDIPLFARSAVAESKAWPEMSPLERAAFNAGVQSVSHSVADTEPLHAALQEFIDAPLKGTRSEAYKLGVYSAAHASHRWFSDYRERTDYEHGLRDGAVREAMMRLKRGILTIPSASEPSVYLKVGDGCLWLHWPDGFINLTHLVGTESICARRDIAHATHAATEGAAK